MRVENGKADLVSDLQLWLAINIRSIKATSHERR